MVAGVFLTIATLVARKLQKIPVVERWSRQKNLELR